MQENEYSWETIKLRKKTQSQEDKCHLSSHRWNVRFESSDMRISTVKMPIVVSKLRGQIEGLFKGGEIECTDIKGNNENT